MEEDIKILENLIDIAEIVLPKYSTAKIKYCISEEQKIAIKHLVKAYKELEEENKKLKIEKISYLKELEDKENKIMEKDLEIIGAEEYTKASMGEIIEHYYTANEECIPKQKIKEKIEEYFEDEEWLVEHDLMALCDDEKECREYYLNKKIALKDIKKAILDKLDKLLKNY